MRKSLVALLFAAALPTLAFGMPGGMHDGPMAAKSPAHVPGAGPDKGTAARNAQADGRTDEAAPGDHQRYLDKLPEAERQAMQKDLDASREKTHQSMRALLKPEQQKAFDEGLKKMEEKRAERAEFLKWKAERDQKN